ncbi:hypothetical protein AGLY_010480, partial [Aphis glycines]
VYYPEVMPRIRENDYKHRLTNIELKFNDFSSLIEDYIGTTVIVMNSTDSVRRRIATTIENASVFLRVDRRRNEEQFAPHCFEPFKQCVKITRWQNFSFIGMLFASLILPRQSLILFYKIYISTIGRTDEARSAEVATYLPFKTAAHTQAQGTGRCRVDSKDREIDMTDPGELNILYVQNFRREYKDNFADQIQPSDSEKYNIMNDVLLYVKEINDYGAKKRKIACCENKINIILTVNNSNYKRNPSFRKKNVVMNII